MGENEHVQASSWDANETEEKRRGNSSLVLLSVIHLLPNPSGDHLTTADEGGQWITALYRGTTAAFPSDFEMVIS